MILRSVSKIRLAGVLAALVAVMPSIAGAATFKTLHAFTGGTDGRQPQGPLVFAGGKIFGATEGSFAMGGPFSCANTDCGTVFTLDPQTGDVTNLHVFGYDARGYFPNAGLISDGTNLYGITYYGGANSLGLVFRVNQKTGAESTLAPLSAVDQAAMTPFLYKGTLIGTALNGTANNNGGGGTVYRIDLATGKTSALYAFKGHLTGSKDAWYPIETPQLNPGMIYGTSVYGGKYGTGGTIWGVSPTTGKEQVLYSFNDPFNGLPDGANPSGNFALLGPIMYGTAGSGGTINKACPAGCGAVFAFDFATNKLTVLHDFDGTDGSGPNSVVAYQGQLYVAAGFGGATGNGAILKIDPQTGKTSTVHAFSGGGDGFWPGQLQLNGGVIYGVTAYLPYASPAGTIFTITP
jgi:uncharacterized repeat protein (TIGR03803 family)